ncbi:MAG: HEAT repeat domain-containing protein [Psychrosphaera sp.]|nr:HEAT repeat domain-containing protein [Psychrosphaera sp.]
MNSQQILTAKVDFLSGNANQDIDETMKQIVDNDPALQQEIAFVEAFWHKDNDVKDEQPGASMDARFYQMLAGAQSAQISALAPILKSSADKPSIWQQLNDALVPQSFGNGMMQVAMMGMVFTLGYYVNVSQSSDLQASAATQDNSMAELKSEVQSLNSLVALSMINNSSASKRLTGINYSRQSGADDETLNDALVKMLNNDKSTAVRLAAIDAFAERGVTTRVEIKLVDALAKQNPLVQIGLIKLLNNHGSEYARIKVAALARQGELTDEAREVYQQFKAMQNKQNNPNQI